MPRAIAGSSSDLNAPQIESLQCTKLPDGSSCHRTLNQATRITPIQNAGMAMPIWVTAEIAVPYQRR